MVMAMVVMVVVALIAAVKHYADTKGIMAVTNLKKYDSHKS